MVHIKEDGNGKDHQLISEDDDTKYNYFQVKEKVRHHSGLNSYEKYDKSKDTIVFCNACGKSVTSKRMFVSDVKVPYLNRPQKNRTFHQGKSC